MIRIIYCPTRQLHINIFIFEKFRENKKQVLHNLAFKRMPQLFFWPNCCKNTKFSFLCLDVSCAIRLTFGTFLNGSAIAASQWQKKSFEIVRRVVVRAICPFGHRIVHSTVGCIENQLRTHSD